DVAPWRLAVVLEVSDQAARIGFQPGREPGGAVLRERLTGIVPIEGVKWVKPATPERGKPTRTTTVGQVLSPGDVIYVDPLAKTAAQAEPQFRLRQIPEVSGAMVVMDPWTGRCSRSLAVSLTIKVNLTVPPRRCVSPAPRSSRSSTRPPSTTAIHRPPLC